MKLIASDIDGTLLRSDRTISETTKQALRRWMEKGNVFAIATGRMFEAGRLVTYDFDYDGYLIACNGGVVKHLKTGEILASNAMDKDIVDEILTICKTYDAYVNMYDLSTIYATRNTNLALKFGNMMQALPKAYHFDIKVQPDLRPIAKEIDVYKLGVFSENAETFLALQKVLQSLGGIEACLSMATSLDITAKGVTKATGIEAIRTHYGISIADVIAFGDHENDQDMIRYAGTGVAMGNATDGLKSISDFITLPNDEDGIPYALRELKLL
jgi:hypothetical protein